METRENIETPLLTEDGELLPEYDLDYSKMRPNPYAGRTDAGKRRTTMPTRTAEAQWNGNLMDGSGTVKLGSGAFEGRYSFRSRMEEGPGTNPEELIGAAHAGCFSMALSAGLSAAGHAPNSVHTTAKVTFDKVGDGFAITRIALNTEADVPGLNDEDFQYAANAAKEGCPVSKALAGTEITLTAKLV